MKQIRTIGQTILGLLFIIYLIGGYQTPGPLANIIDTVPGKLVIAIVSFSFFLSVHPLLGILGLIVAYEIIRRSIGHETASVIYMPSEVKRASQMAAFNDGNVKSLDQFNEGDLNAYNQFPYTLEQEMVSKMTPARHGAVVSSPPSFIPNPENIHDASLIQEVEVHGGCGN